MIDRVAVLDMDGTLLSKRSIDVFCTELDLNQRLAEVDALSPRRPPYKTSEIIASFFKSVPKRRLEDLQDTIPLNKGADSFVRFLKSEGFLVAIATDSYQFLAEKLAKSLGADTAYGNLVEVRDGRLTGRLLTDHRCLKIEGCREYSTCKLWFMRKLMKGSKGLTVAVGDGDSDFCAISGADIGVAYRPKTDLVAAIADMVGSDFSQIEAWVQRKIAGLRNQ